MSMTISERNCSEEELFYLSADKTKIDIRCCMPGEIQDFDPATQTATVKLLLRELMNGQWIEIPKLVDVPVCMPRCGGFYIAMPVKASDEVLVVFGDMCMDAWWQNGGVQNQAEIRRHDLSDGFAIPCVWSQPNVIEDYPTDRLRIKHEEGEAAIEITDSDEIQLSVGGTALEATTDSIKLEADGAGVEISGGTTRLFGNIVFDGSVSCPLAGTHRGG